MHIEIRPNFIMSGEIMGKICNLQQEIIFFRISLKFNFNLSLFIVFIIRETAFSRIFIRKSLFWDVNDV